MSDHEDTWPNDPTAKAPAEAPSDGMNLEFPTDDTPAPLPDWYTATDGTTARVALRDGGDGAHAEIRLYTRREQCFIDRKADEGRAEFRDAVVLCGLAAFHYKGIAWPPAQGTSFEARRKRIGPMSGRDFDRVWLAMNKLNGAGGDDAPKD